MRAMRAIGPVRVWQALLSLGNSKHLLLRMLSQPKGFEFLTQQVRFTLSCRALRCSEPVSGPVVPLAVLCASH